MILKPFVVFVAFIAALATALSSSSLTQRLSSDDVPKNALTISENTPSSTSTSSSPSSDPKSVTVNITDSTVLLSRDPDLGTLFITAQALKEKGITGLPLMVDTTSAETWFLNDTCTNGCAARPFFDILTDQVDYLKSIVFENSVLDLDMVNVGKNDINLSLGLVDFELAEIGIAQNMPDSLANFTFSGVFGFASCNDSFVELLISSGVISKRFALLIVIDDDVDEVVWDNSSTLPPYPVGGLLRFGEAIDIQEEEYSDSHALVIGVDENDTDIWSFDTSVQVAINNETSRTTVLSNGLAVIDTTVSGISMPLKDADQFHLQLFGIDYATDSHGTYLFPCNVSGTLYFEFSHQSVMLLLPIPMSSIMGEEANDEYLQNYCVLKIKGVDGNHTTWNLGTSFLTNYRVDFDLDKKQMGFTKNNLRTYHFLQNATDDSNGSYSTLVTASQMLVTKTYVESGSSTSTVGSNNVSRKTSNGGLLPQRGVLQLMWLLLMLF